MAKRIFDPAKHCGATVRQGPNKGGRCTLAKGWGTKHQGYGCCRQHGGNSPNHIKKAKREMAAEAVVTYGLPREVTPELALLEEVYRTAGHVSWLEIKVKEAEEEDLVFGVTTNTSIVTKEGGLVPYEVKQEAKPSVWLTLYHKERQHLVDVCRIAIASGIAERQVRLAEDQGQVIAQVLRGTLADLGVDDDKKVASALRKNLMLVSDDKNRTKTRR